MNFINNKTLIYILLLFSIIHFLCSNKKYYEKMSNTCQDADVIKIKNSETELNCNHAKNDGACNKDVEGYPNSQIVRAMCPKSCNIKNNREDVDDTNWNRKVKLNCETAVKEGACENKVKDYPEPDIVKKYCPISCKVPVRELEDHEEPGWKKKSTSETLTCFEAKRKGLCNKKINKRINIHASEVNKKCPKTCNSCHGINCDEPDKHKFCKRWVNNGECRTNPTYMFHKYHGCNCSCSKWCKEQIAKNTIHANFCKKRIEIDHDDYSLQS